MRFNTPSAVISLFWLAAIVAAKVSAFSPPSAKIHSVTTRPSTTLCQSRSHASDDDVDVVAADRRRLLRSSSFAALTLASAWNGVAPVIANAAETGVLQDEVEMKVFADTATPSLFVIEVPKRFFALRRSAKGDLPDAKTGKGRRGGTIFTAGDMAKAEVIAIERFPTTVLLEDAGYEATGDLSSFTSIGNPAAVANLLLRRREKDKPGTQNQSMLVKDSVSVSPDGFSLMFSLRQEINVQKPELLMEQEGLSELFRTTVAKATLGSKDGQMMVVFASALDQDYGGPDGVALRRTVDSFTALSQSN